MEPLEARVALSVTLNADGWTDITLPAAARAVYVSSSAGDDAHDGFSPQSPVKTLAKGVSLMRQRLGDHLLLARGDTWNESLGVWGARGASAEEPAMIGTYGSGARPLLQTTDFAFRIHNPNGISHVAMIGIHMRFVGTAAADGVSVTGISKDLLIEDCLVEGYQNNMMIEASRGPIEDVRIRRCVIVDAQPTSNSRNSQGIFLEDVKTILLEENLFDSNGWSASRKATIFNHGVYVRANCTGLKVVRNVFANSASHGLQARCGGIVEDNIFIDNPTGMSFGLVNNSPLTPGGVTGRVANNLFIGGRDLSGEPRGVGIEIGNVKRGGTYIENNLFTHGGSHPNFAAIRVASGYNNPNVDLGVGINDLYIRGNIIYRWSQGFELVGGLHMGRFDYPWGLTNLQVTDNDFQQIRGTLVQHDSPIEPIVPYALPNPPILWMGNRYHTNTTGWEFFTAKAFRAADWIEIPMEQWVRDYEPTAKFVKIEYPDPNRSIGTYSKSIAGDDTTAGFLDAARQQTRGNWKTALTATPLRNHIFEGFDLSVAPPPATSSLDASADLEATVWSLSKRNLTLSVTYAGGSGLDLASLNDADVILSRANGSTITASDMQVLSADTGTVTYSFTSPNGKWRKKDAGDWSLLLQLNQVSDLSGSFVEAKTLGTFELKLGTAPRHVTVVKTQFRQRNDTQIVIRFSGPVSKIADSEMVISGPDGEQTIPAEMQHIAMDARHRTATLTFPGLPDKRLNAGSYQLHLNAALIVDQFGREIDGDQDGIAGGNFSASFTI